MTRQEVEILRNKSNAIRELYLDRKITKQQAKKRYDELGLAYPNYLKEENDDLYGEIDELVQEMALQQKVLSIHFLITTL